MQRSQAGTAPFLELPLEFLPGVDRSRNGPPARPHIASATTASHPLRDTLLPLSLGRPQGHEQPTSTVECPRGRESHFLGISDPVEWLWFRDSNASGVAR